MKMNNAPHGRTNMQTSQHNNLMEPAEIAAGNALSAGIMDTTLELLFEPPNAS